jgi:hypothetical protein
MSTGTATDHARVSKIVKEPSMTRRPLALCALASVVFLQLACGSSAPGGATGTGGTTATGGSSGSSTGGSPGAGGSTGGASGTTGGASGTTGGAPGTPDSGVAPDSAGASAPDSGGSTPGGTVACGTTPAGFDLSSIKKSEGLVVGPDGTVYLSDFGNHVIRYAPPYDKPPELTWATVPGATILGVMLDPKAKVIYAGARVSNKLYKIDVTDPTKVMAIADVEGGVNGLTMGDDGSVFYSDQNSGMIYRVTADGMKAAVTKTGVASADGIAFGPDKQLYVIPYKTSPPITRLKLENNVEVSREVYATVTGGGNGDGIAFDKDGNVYVTAGGLWKISATDKKATMIDPAGGANVEFGAGALSCSQIIWASGPPHTKMSDIVGLDVYWHRP